MDTKKAEMALLAALILFLAPMAVYAGNGEMKDTLGKNEKLRTSEELKSTNGRYTLAMQGDGNLVAYDSQEKALWSSNTMGSGATECVMQEDGNLLLINALGRVVWAADTAGYKNAKLMIQNDGNLVIYNERGLPVWAKGIFKDRLSSDEKLLANEFIRSQNRNYTLRMQDDGNLVVQDNQGKVFWSSNTGRSRAEECVLQGDGNLLLKDRNGRLVWATNTDGHSNAALLIQNDGDVILFKEGEIPFWSNGKMNKDIKPEASPADEPAAYNANTGDTEFDNALSNLNHTAYADLDNFMNKLSGAFGISKPWIENLVKRENIPPADVYMIARTASITNHPIDTVVKNYMANRGQGWGVIAKQLGIKQGSKEFHALKKDDKGLLSKGKSKGKKKKIKTKVKLAREKHILIYRPQ